MRYGKIILVDRNRNDPIRLQVELPTTEDLALLNNNIPYEHLLTVDSYKSTIDKALTKFIIYEAT